MRGQRRVSTIGSHIAAQQQSAAPARPAACAAEATAPPGAADPPPPPPDTRCAVPVGPDGLLAREHVDAYVRDGFIAVSGLIPPAVLGPAIDCMWRVMDRENRQSWRGPPLPARAQPLDRADPSTWTGGWQGMLTSPEILATFTSTYINVARQLAAANAAASLFPVAPHLPTKPPLTRRNPHAPPTDHGYRTDLGTPEGDPGYPFVLTKPGTRQTRRGYPIAIHNFPDPAAAGSTDGPPRSAAEYSPHIDGGGEEDGWRVSPQPVSIQASTILGAAGVSGCGGTLVWPGLHRAMAREYLRCSTLSHTDCSSAQNLSTARLYRARLIRPSS
jgi:hypothetical protein